MPAAAQHDHVVLQVLADLLDRRVFQDRLQGGQRRRRVEMRLARRRAKRQIPRLAVVPGERHADQLRPTRPDAGRLGVEREGLLLPQLGEERVERLGRVDEVGGERESGADGRAG